MQTVWTYEKYLCELKKETGSRVTSARGTGDRKRGETLSLYPSDQSCALNSL